MRRAFAALLVLAAAGCGSPYPAAPTGSPPSPGASADDGVLSLSVAPAPYALQALVRRWRVADIYDYVITLQRWNGSSFVDFDPPLTVVLPQKVETPKQQAVFTNLKQGAKYRAVLVVRGNAGGTAPTEVLNADTPTAPVFDLTAAQDVQDELAMSLHGQLDAIPFAGSAAVFVDAVPVGATDLEAALKDATSGETLATIAYPVDGRATFSNLKAGTEYQVVVTAKQGTATLQTTTSAPFSWDPAATDLETDRVVNLAF